MLRGAFVLLALVSALASAQTQYGTPAASHEPAKMHTGAACPWITEGTAAHVLGGDTSVTVTATNPDEGSCRFARQPDARDALEISVGKLPAHACPPDSLKLKGVGNEASRCRLAGSHDAEMIAGRVRERGFTVVLRLPGQKNDGKAKDPQNDALEQIAEMVAGSLY